MTIPRLLPALLLSVLPAFAQSSPDRLPPVRVAPPDQDRPGHRGEEIALPGPPPPTDVQLREARLRAEAGGGDVEALRDRTDEAFSQGRPPDGRKALFTAVCVFLGGAGVYLVATLLRLKRKL